MKVVLAGQPATNVTVGNSAQNDKSFREKAIAHFSTPQPTPNEQLTAPPTPQEVAQAQPPAIPTPTIEEPSIDPSTTLNEPAKEPTADTKLSSQYALLARKERALRAKAQETESRLKQQEEAFKAKEAELQARLDEYSKNYISRDVLKQSPLDVLEETGLSYDELTNQALNRQPRNPRVESQMSKLEALIKQQEQKIQELEQNSRKAQEQQYNSALSQIEKDVKKLVATDPNFEAIKHTGNEKEVVDLIKMHFDESGEVLDYETAAKMIEDEIISQTEKLLNIPKVKSKWAPKASTPKAQPPVQTPVQTKQTQPSRTLTNAISSSRQLSARERAILAFKGQST